MRSLIIILLLTFVSPALGQTSYLSDMPETFRTLNWLGSEGPNDGSCVHATIVNCLKWIGEHELARNWEMTHGGGEFTSGILASIEGVGIPYAMTYQDPKGCLDFLKWAARSRLMVGARTSWSHAQNIVDVDDTHIWLLNNNPPDGSRGYPPPLPIKKVKLSKFMPDFIASDCLAWVFIGTPPPPYPRVVNWQYQR
jgi:hypothetical protein